MQTSNNSEDNYLPSISESQIMTTLNSSIEDLLSKIFKVQQQYESSTRVLHPRSLKSLQNHQKDMSQKEMKSVSSIGDTLPASSASKLTGIQDECWKQNQKPLRDYRFESSFSATMHSIQFPKIVNRSTSLKAVQQQTQQQFYALKNNKINSLFDHPSIKELQSSQIITTQPNEENQPSLLLGTKQVQEIMVNSFIHSPQDNHICSNLSLGQFEVGQTVGSGKFGDVYLCRHKKTGFLFALKKIFKSTIKDYGMQAQFCLELKLLYFLNHPNIVKLYGHFSDEYHIFLLMEYIQGGELLSKLGSDQKYVSRILQPLLQTVQHLHNQSIIHRDIKPENIVLAFDTPKLCDFGWATSCNRNIMKQTFCGTPDYLSPQMKNGESYTCSVDLWSLGVLVYQMITGSAPFKEQIAHWKRKGGNYRWNWEICYPPSVSALAENFMKHLLRENPDERASLRTCRNHFFIKKYKQVSSEIVKQITI